MTPGADDEFSVLLSPEPASAPRARELCASSCRTWGLDEVVDDVALVVTELVANAVRHAGSQVEVRLRRTPSGVRLEVTDGSTRPLRPRDAVPGDEGGRGLLLVDALSTRYGVEADPRGKRVWAEIENG